MAHHEIVLGIVGGLFVVEALSVIIQVFFYKRTGRRVFKMAPIHHHFEQLGWSEPTVVIRFWIVALRACAGGAQHAEAAVITARAWAGKRYGVLGLARSGAATVRALLASGASVVAWDSDEARRLSILPELRSGRGTSEAGGGAGAAGAAHHPSTTPAARSPSPSELGEDGGLAIADLDTVDLTTLDALVVSPGVPLNTHPLAAKARTAAVPDRRRHRAVRAGPQRAAAAQGRRHHRHQRQVDHHRADPPHSANCGRADA